MKIRFAKSDISEGLIISSGFVDEHMISANGEFVKVYLFLVRRAGREVELWEIADALHMLESDVGRALKYWKSKGVLTVEETPVLPESPSFLREEKEDSFRQETEAAREEPPVSFEREKGEESDQEESAGEGAIKESVRREPDLNKLSDDEEFAALLYCSQKALSKIFAQTDIRSFAYLYDILGMPADLLEYLVEECAKRGKTSVRYIESVAIDWHRRGIDSAMKAKASGQSIYSPEETAVMRALGLSSRLPVEAEREFIQKWQGELGFSLDIILEACRRNIMTISQPSFSYVDSILMRWHKDGVRILSDIAPLDDLHEERKRRVKEDGPAKNKNNKFNTFPQRDDDLEKHMQDKLRSWL